MYNTLRSVTYLMKVDALYFLNGILRTNPHLRKLMILKNGLPRGVVVRLLDSCSSRCNS